MEEHGGAVIQADKLAHAAMHKGKKTFGKIIKTFGEGILGEDGEINRRALGALVFGAENKAKLETLEQIIHPYVISEITAFIQKTKTSGKYSFAVIDAPLLIESGLNKLCTTCWLITAPETARLSRIMTRDNIDLETAKRRLQSRPGDETLRPHANVIIENAGDPEDLRQFVIQLL